MIAKYTTNFMLIPCARYLEWLNWGVTIALSRHDHE